VITSPRYTAKTPTFFGIRAEKIIPIFQTVVASGGDGGEWGGGGMNLWERGHQYRKEK
jgi:hypothetical protein